MRRNNLFQSTLPVWGGTSWPCSWRGAGIRFQSTLPVWGGTRRIVDGMRIPAYISIHPPRVGRDFLRFFPRFGIAISIHPPRVGRDSWPIFHTPNINHFNPPSPCGEGLLLFIVGYFFITFQSTLPVWGGTFSGTTAPPTGGFQSTLPVWGGTGRNKKGHYNQRYFNPPSPCGEGQICRWHHERWDGRISIHPPRVGRDVLVRVTMAIFHKFQSTLPVWGGT